MAKSNLVSLAAPKQVHRSVPLADTKFTVGKGYPDKLVIFKIAASKFWWVRYYTQGRILKKSTKTEDKRKATAEAIKFYEEILLRERNLLPLGASPSFEKCARELILEQRQLIERKERSDKLNVNDEQKLSKDILPFFGGMHVKDITYRHLNEYVRRLTERDLKPPTIKNHLNLIHKILTLAQRENLIQQVPVFPKVKRVDNPRGWFTQHEYEQLKKTTVRLIKKNVFVRGHQITDEMRLLITFMVNSFLRPNDLKYLRHRNIQVVEGQNTYLRIQTDKSKTANTPVVTMEAAVGIYSDLVKFHQTGGNPVSPDDYVFFPRLTGVKSVKAGQGNKEGNRDYAMQTMRRLFDEILNEAKLKTNGSGEPRTLYSLRHTAIMFRLTLGESIDILTLARNARTSAAMIDRFYARPLQAEMNVHKIQSMRDRKSQEKPKSRNN